MACFPHSGIKIPHLNGLHVQRGPKAGANRKFQALESALNDACGEAKEKTPRVGYSRRLDSYKIEEWQVSCQRMHRSTTSVDSRLEGEKSNVILLLYDPAREPKHCSIFSLPTLFLMLLIPLMCNYVSVITSWTYVLSVQLSFFF